MKKPIQPPPPPPPFPIDALPQKTRQLVGEIQQLSHASESTIVSAVLAAMAVATTSNFYIEHEDRSITRPHLFFVNIDDTAAPKHKVFTRVFAGLHRRELQVNLALQEKLLQAQFARERLLNLINQRLQDPQSPKPDLKLDELISQLTKQSPEIDPQKLIYDGHKDPQLLKQVRQGNSVIALINPEADGIFSGASLKNLDQLCRAWDVHDMTIREPQPGELRHLVLKRSCATVFLSARTKAFAAYLGNKKKPPVGVGFLERCLFSVPAFNATSAITTHGMTPFNGTDFWLPKVDEIVLALIKTSAPIGVTLDESAQKMFDGCIPYYYAGCPPYINLDDMHKRSPESLPII